MPTASQHDLPYEAANTVTYAVGVRSGPNAVRQHRTVTKLLARLIHNLLQLWQKLDASLATPGNCGTAGIF